MTVQKTQSFILNCSCNISPGIIIENNKIVCRWCRKELVKGGTMIFNQEEGEKK